jgi:hydrogenase maturation protein HypF
MAAAALQHIGRGAQIEQRFPGRPAAAAVAQMLARGLRCPPTSSMGRWFDAAAGLLGVRETAAYEGQAPMLLEALAASAPPGAHDTHDTDLAELVQLGDDGSLDPGPLLERLADADTHADDLPRAAALFHRAIADGLARWVVRAALATGLRRVALGGGCFLNALLTALLVPKLHEHGLQVIEARQAPPNDGGIALGQAWVAACTMHDGA